MEEDKFVEQQFIDGDSKFSIKIGNDVWIGTNAMILDGITIGDGAIISAGAIITKDVKPYSIVAGAPGKVIGYRFTDTQIEKLLKIKWWNWDIEEIKAKSHLFNDVEMFTS